MEHKEVGTEQNHPCKCSEAEEACIEMTARMLVDMNDIIAQINVALSSMVTENVVQMCSMFGMDRDKVVAKALEMKRDIINGTAFQEADSEGGSQD